MSEDITYSLRKALEDNLPEITKAQIISDGVSLTDIEKPFLTIEYLDETPLVTATGRESYLDTYNYQVGVFARDISELLQLQTKVREVIREKYGHTLYTFDTQTDTFVDSGDVLPFDDNGFTPIRNEDSSNTTFDHHGYFDVGARVY